MFSSECNLTEGILPIQLPNKRDFLTENSITPAITDVAASKFTIRKRPTRDFRRVVMVASRFRIRFVFPVVHGFLPVVSQYCFPVALRPKTLSESEVPSSSIRFPTNTSRQASTQLSSISFRVRQPVDTFLPRSISCPEELDTVHQRVISIGPLPFKPYTTL